MKELVFHRLFFPAMEQWADKDIESALRWARVLRGLGHTVAVQQDYRGENCDMLVALHARKRAGAAARFRERNARPAASRSSRERGAGTSSATLLTLTLAFPGTFTMVSMLTSS